VISRRAFDPVEHECIRRYRLQTTVQLVSHASDLDLRRHYNNATAFVYPSEYEGFGLPILEAMASGTLVATSNRASMPEVGGDVAFYFDPYSIESIAGSLHHVVDTSAEERHRLLAKGIARARAFTWEKCQQHTIDILQYLLGQTE
jgi:glycosyltransferase involved in cell wall biosynthesis